MKRNSKLKFIKFTTTVFMLFLISACAATRINTYSIDGKETICHSNINLGSIVVLPEAAWRHDQKEPIKREQTALNEIKKAFKEISCGTVSLPNGIKQFSNWSGISEAKTLEKFSNEGFDTIIIIRIEELTPRLNITYSIPFLWSGSNEADFRVKVMSIKTAKVLNDMRIKRVTGGLFNIRPAEWSRKELYAALLKIVKQN